MKLNRFAMVALLLSAFALPVQAQNGPNLDYRLPAVGIAGLMDESQPWSNTLSQLLYVPQMGAWCAQFSYYQYTYGGCLAEYQIPPAQVRALRAAAGLPVDAPVWNGATGEFVSLPPGAPLPPPLFDGPVLPPLPVTP